jgi:tetratricopeptide (TPR) repeat protein
MGEPSDGGRIAEISHWIGCAYKSMHDEDNALKAFQKSITNERKESAIAYYQALSWRELGEEKKASEILAELVSFAQNGMKSEEQDTFFEKFGQKESDSKRRSHLHYLCALGFLGLGEQDNARKELKAAININANHLMAKVELEDLR